MRIASRALRGSRFLLLSGLAGLGLQGCETDSVHGHDPDSGAGATSSGGPNSGGAHSGGTTSTGGTSATGSSETVSTGGSFPEGTGGADAGTQPDAGGPDGGAPDTDGGSPDGGGLTGIDCSSYAPLGGACFESDSCRAGLRCDDEACQSRLARCSLDEECGHFGTCEGEAVHLGCVKRKEACFDWRDCAVGSRCGKDGKCVVGPVDGEPPKDDQCARGYRLDGATRRCQKRNAPGEACLYSDSCVEEAACVPETVDEGAPTFCRLPGQTTVCLPGICRPGFTCVHVPGDWAFPYSCVEQTADLGKPCSATAISFCTDVDCVDRQLCRSGLYCGPNNACIPWPKPGEACVPSLHYPCGPDQYCDASGVCRTNLEAGERCDAPATCTADSSCRRVVDVYGACEVASCKPDACSKNCAQAVCGDGIVCCGAEQCDDSNTRSGDGCSSSCKWEAVQVVTSGIVTCALGANGFVKCWGGHSGGDLGIAARTVRGDEPNELGAHLPIVQLGTGRKAKKLWAFFFVQCAKLDDESVKCWNGGKGAGTLGLGEPGTRGYLPGEMGDHLPAIDFGVGRTALDMGDRCAVLDDGSVKCWWGYDPDPIGDEPGEMGDNLPPLNLGAGVKATAIGGRVYSLTCAGLEGGSLKCWSNSNLFGELGQGDTAEHTDPSALPPIALGTNRKVSSFAVGYYHVCALLDHGAVKCWGNNVAGQLGLGDTKARGQKPGDMGDALPSVDLGTGRTATMIAAGEQHTCALLDDGSVKCWGSNYHGEIGQGDTAFRGGKPGEMGDALKAVDLGPGRTAKHISAASNSTCVVLDDGRVKCWGSNERGNLGLGDTQDRGDQPGEMGDALPSVDLEF